ALGRVRLSTRSSADVQAGDAFEGAIVLCRRLDRIELLTRALWGYWFNKAHRRELAVAQDAAQELLSVAQRENDRSAEFVAQGMYGITRFWQAHFEEARSHLQIACELCPGDEQERYDLAIVSTNLDNHLRTQLALTLTCLGYLEKAATQAKLAL